MADKAVVKCPSCSQAVGIPVRDKTIVVPCPCGHQFHSKSGEVIAERSEWHSHRVTSFFTPSTN